MMRDGIVLLWSRLCASNLVVIRHKGKKHSIESARVPSAGTSSRFMGRSPMTASKGKVVALAIWRRALQDFYRCHVVPFL